MPLAGRLPQRVLRVAKPWAFSSCPARRGVAGHAHHASGAGPSCSMCSAAGWWEGPWPIIFATLECELIDRRSFQTQAEARMRSSNSWKAGITHAALGYLSPNDFERAAAATHPVGNGDQHDRTDLEAFQIGEPEGKKYPPGVPYRPGLEKTLLPPASAHLRAGGHQPSTVH